MSGQSGSPPRRAGLLRPLGLLLLAGSLVTCSSDAPLAPRPVFHAATTVNLLQDPGFESGGAAWRNSNASGRLVTGVKVHSGAKALRIMAAVKVGKVVYQEVPATAGDALTASAWVAADGLAGLGASVELLWLDTLGLPDAIPPQHLLLSEVVGRLNGTATWTELSRAATAPAGARAVRVGLRLSGESDGVGKAAFDDLSLARPDLPADSLPPTVRLIAPTEDATLSGITLFSADASDDVGVTAVRFRADGNPIGPPVTAAPWSMSFGTAALANGAHLLDATAEDAAGNLATSEPVHVTVSNSRPRDVVVILTDDQRFDLMPQMPLTSALLNAETVRFEQGLVTTSLCCPSRSSILTGQYVHRHGVYTNNLPNGGALKFNPASTVATWLHDAGYRTALVGKYLNEYTFSAPPIPPGWNEWDALITTMAYYNERFNQNGVQVSYGTQPADYITTVLTGMATRFIQSTPVDQPLFLYFTPNAPHNPATPDPVDIGRYASWPNWRPPSFNEVDVSDKPAWIRALPRQTAGQIATADAFHRSQLEALQAVDRSVVAIVDALKAAGRWDNTLLIFLSDNGYSWNEHRMMNVKACPYEECIRVPFWIRAPGLTARADSSLVANIDLAPTIAAWAGVTSPTLVNGRNLLPLLDNPAAPWRADLLIEHEKIGQNVPDMQGVRTTRYMYNEIATGERELYDLLADPWELTNVANLPANGVLVATLQARLAQLRVE